MAADIRLFRVNASAFMTKKGSTNTATLFLSLKSLKAVRKPIIKIGSPRSRKDVPIWDLTFFTILAI